MRFRWEEFSPPERREFANYTVNLITEVAGPTEEWALKSQTAALVAEVLFPLPFVINSLSVFLLSTARRNYNFSSSQNLTTHLLLDLSGLKLV